MLNENVNNCDKTPVETFVLFQVLTITNVVPNYRNHGLWIQSILVKNIKIEKPIVSHGNISQGKYKVDAIISFDNVIIDI